MAMPVKQVWVYSVMQDATYRAKFETDPIGAACIEGKCEKCVFWKCEHWCHMDQVFVDPLNPDGSWKGLGKFAWLPKDSNTSVTIKV